MEFIFFLPCLQDRITHWGQFLSCTIPRKCPSPRRLEFDCGLTHYIVLIYFSHGNCWASSGKHRQFLNEQFQAGAFKRQPNRVLMPYKIIMKDIYEKKKFQWVWKPGPTLWVLTADGWLAWLILVYFLTWICLTGPVRLWGLPPICLMFRTNVWVLD